VNNKLVERQVQFSGAYLMNAGINVNLRGDFDATAVILERQ
jgi:Glycosyl hydrolase family 36 C-terminal domain